MKATPLRRFGYWLFDKIFRLTLKLDVQGQEHIPSSGPLIAACNHANFLDPFMVDQYMGRPMYFFAKEEIKSMPLFGFLARYYMVIFVARGEADMNALKSALRVLREGYAIYVAPEGTRSKTGELQEGKIGAVIMATRTGANVVPCAIWGQKPFLSNLKRLKRTAVHIRFGPAFRFVGSVKPGKVEVQAMTDEMMYRIAELMPPQWRGAYAGTPSPYRYTVALDSAEALTATAPSV